MPCDKEKSFYNCYKEQLKKESFDDCPDSTKCMPYQNMSEVNALPFCESKCGLQKASEVLEKVLENPKCKRNCTILQYSETFQWEGNNFDDLSEIGPNVKAFFFQFPLKKMIVREEYIITNEIELIAYSGGVLGLFIGFSFQVVIHFIIKKFLVWNAYNKE